MKKGLSGKKELPKAKGPMTLDTLAAMVAGGFEQTVSKADFESHMDGFEMRMKAVEGKLSSLHNDVLSMHFDYRKLKARIEDLEIDAFGSIREP